MVASFKYNLLIDENYKDNYSMTPIEIILLVSAVLALCYFVSTYNAFIRLRNKVEESFSTMDVYLKKRWDLIPNLVEIVKGYATHEQETLDRVIQARNMAMNSGGISELKNNENALTSSLKSLFALSEAYPDLKANNNFITLQKQLEAVENDILQARKYFNAVVKTFNTKRELFPSSIIANMMKLKKKDYFDIDASERKNIKVKL
ncbi:LemA family protein [Psychromonas arctica]|uniref:LemA family protein n=1 Tax=Psychromonas arctica TaxID=168275 RepID=UPI002FD07421